MDLARFLMAEFSPTGLVLYGVLATTTEYDAGILAGTFLPPLVLLPTIDIPEPPPTTPQLALIRARNDKIIEDNKVAAHYIKYVAVFKASLIAGLDSGSKAALQSQYHSVGVAILTTQRIWDYLHVQYGDIPINDAIFVVNLSQTPLSSDSEIIPFIAHLKKHTLQLAQNGQTRAVIDLYMEFKQITKTSQAITLILVEWERHNQKLSLWTMDIIYQFVLDNITKSSIVNTQVQDIHAAVAQALAAERALYPPMAAAVAPPVPPSAPKARPRGAPGGPSNRTGQPRVIQRDLYCWYHGTGGHLGKTCTVLAAAPYTEAHRAATSAVEIMGQRGRA